MNLEKNLAEMAQGILVSQRHARLAQLERWEKANKIVMRYQGGSSMYNGLRCQAWLVAQSDPRIPRGIMLAECGESKDFPTAAFVAQVALGIQALSNFEGVKEPDPVKLTQEQIEQRKHVIDWKKWAPA
jgi:hypothetical protein